jgi:hypothetical protein
MLCTCCVTSGVDTLALDPSRSPAGCRGCGKQVHSLAARSVGVLCWSGGVVTMAHARKRHVRRMLIRGVREWRRGGRARPANHSSARLSSSEFSNDTGEVFVRVIGNTAKDVEKQGLQLRLCSRKV